MQVAHACLLRDFFRKRKSGFPLFVSTIGSSAHTNTHSWVCAHTHKLIPVFAYVQMHARAFVFVCAWCACVCVRARARGILLCGPFVNPLHLLSSFVPEEVAAHNGTCMADSSTADQQANGAAGLPPKTLKRSAGIKT